MGFDAQVQYSLKDKPEASMPHGRIRRSRKERNANRSHIVLSLSSDTDTDDLQKVYRLLYLLT